MSEPMSLIAGAIESIRAGNQVHAQELLEKAVRIAPGTIEAHSLLGVVYAQTDEFDLAVAEFRRALSLNPDHLTTLRNLARVLERQGREEEALEVIGHALTLDPDDEANCRIYDRLAPEADDDIILGFDAGDDELIGYCPVCENPIPVDTDRRTCDLCGVSWVPLLSGRVRIEETLRIGEEQLVCSNCGSVIDEYKAMHCVWCGHDFLSGTTPTENGEAADHPGEIEASDRQGAPSGLIIAGGILCFIMALMLWGLSGLQSLLTAAGIESATGFWALLNGVVGVGYAIFGVGVLQQSKWGYDWAFGSSVLNVVFMGLQILGGAVLLVPAAVVALTIALLLYPVRENFS